jgi:hypothetical protein
MATVGLSRAEATTIFNIRVNRAPFARDTQARHGRAPSAECPDCGAERQDSLHLLLACPALDAQRRDAFGSPPEAARLRDPRRLLDFVRRLP